MIGKLDGHRPASGIACRGSYAYVASSTGLKIIDVSAPPTPTPVGFLAGEPRDIALSGQYAYLAGAGVDVVDISKPDSPVWVGGYQGGYARGIAVSGASVYLAAGSAGLQIIDVSFPAYPAQVGSFGTSDARDVAINGTYAYVVDGAGVKIIDVSLRRFPQQVAQYGPLKNPRRIALDIPYVYVADQFGLIILRTDLVGDTNCDWEFNFSDINPFVLALADPNEYRQKYPDCNPTNADCNDDGEVTEADVNPFLKLLVGPPPHRAER